VLVALVIVFGVTTRNFASWTTARALANQAPDTLLVATGMTLVIVTGGIDLSVGSVMALSAAVFGLVLMGPVGSLPVAMVSAIVTGACAGLANGAISVRWRLPTFLVTLGMLEMARGATYLLTDSRTLYLGARVDLVNRDLILGVGAPAILAVLVIASGQFMLTRMVFGRELLAVGTNSEAARLAGISPGRVRIAAFALSGALAGLAAIVQAGRLAAVDPNAGTGLELDAIAAVVIGGASLSGGRGSVVASALGALVILVLGAGLAQLGVQEPTRRLVTGAVIIAAAIVDHYRVGSTSAR
jgi:ribose transport system permease protein